MEFDFIFIAHPLYYTDMDFKYFFVLTWYKLTGLLLVSTRCVGQLNVAGLRGEWVVEVVESHRGVGGSVSGELSLQ